MVAIRRTKKQPQEAAGTDGPTGELAAGEREARDHLDWGLEPEGSPRWPNRSATPPWQDARKPADTDRTVVSVVAIGERGPSRC